MQTNERDDVIDGVPETAAAGAHIHGMHNSLATWERWVEQTQVQQGHTSWYTSSTARISPVSPKHVAFTKVNTHTLVDLFDRSASLLNESPLRWRSTRI